MKRLLILSFGVSIFAFATAGALFLSGVMTSQATGCPQDSDCDGFRNSIENHVGTNPLVACGLNAWPADFNNDLRSDDLDRKRVQDHFGQSVPPAPVRYDIAPEPAGDNLIDSSDLARLSGLDGQECELVPPPADSDGDGFSDIIENHIGTDPNVRCPLTSTPDDEPVDAWPPDYNDDGFADTSDLAQLSNWYGQDVPPAPVRLDIAPDPFFDNHIGDEDTREGQEYYGQNCTP